jgi:hypothetical protein
MLQEFESFRKFAWGHDLAMCCFKFDLNRFGDWEIELAYAYRRFRLSWYGREGWVFLTTKLLRQPKGAAIGWHPEWGEVARMPDDAMTSLQSSESYEAARRLLLEHLESFKPEG